MPTPDANRVIDPDTAASPNVQSEEPGPKINPVTGLSTDYLNHFTEAIMVLEIAKGEPEYLNDLAAWKPKTYAEHFAHSHFSNRQAVIGAYGSADPAIRIALDHSSKMLNVLVDRTREMVIKQAGTPEAEAITRRALEQLKPLLAWTAAVINGKPANSGAQDDPQAAIDAMFAA